VSYYLLFIGQLLLFLLFISSAVWIPLGVIIQVSNQHQKRTAMMNFTASRALTVNTTQLSLLQDGVTQPQTAQGITSCIGKKGIKKNILHIMRNQGVVDQRTKDITAKLKKKQLNRKIDQMVERIDIQMQKLLETQDPANEELYDKFAERREWYLSQKM
jgi:hypothetical protein